MQEVLLSKVVVNMGVGAEPDWGLRPGVPIGLVVTLRGNDAVEFLKKALVAKANKLPAKSFDRTGNFGFGVREYIDLPGAKYDPKLGIKGFDVLVSLKKKGYRVKIRKIKQSKVGIKQRVTTAEAIDFARSLGVEVE